MAVSRSYKMPCNKLDLADIEAATAAVAASFPGVTRTVEANDPRCINCTFLIPLELARQWHNNQINWVGDEDLPPGPIPVQVDFQHLPADSNSAQDLFLMSIDAGYPATNGLCWWTAAEIVERLCRHWGNRCELL